MKEQETHLCSKGEQAQSEGAEDNILNNGIQGKADAAVLTPDKTDFKIKRVTRDQNEHYVMIKRAIRQEDIILIHICEPNLGAPKGRK